MMTTLCALSLSVIPAAAESKVVLRACENDKKTSFQRDVLPPLQESCAGCHYSEQTVPPLNLTTQAAYANIVGKKSSFVDELLVKPGDPDQSLIVEKVARKPRFGQQMPPYGRSLTPRELRLLVDWIRQGAKNN